MFQIKYVEKKKVDKFGILIYIERDTICNIRELYKRRLSLQTLVLSLLLRHQKQICQQQIEKNNIFRIYSHLYILYLKLGQLYP